VVHDSCRKRAQRQAQRRRVVGQSVAGALCAVADAYALTEHFARDEVAKLHLFAKCLRMTEEQQLRCRAQVLQLVRSREVKCHVMQASDSAALHAEMMDCVRTSGVAVMTQHPGYQRLRDAGVSMAKILSMLVSCGELSERDLLSSELRTPDHTISTGIIPKVMRHPDNAFEKADTYMSLRRRQRLTKRVLWSSIAASVGEGAEFHVDLVDGLNHYFGGTKILIIIVGDTKQLQEWFAALQEQSNDIQLQNLLTHEGLRWAEIREGISLFLPCGIPHATMTGENWNGYAGTSLLLAQTNSVETSREILMQEMRTNGVLRGHEAKLYEIIGDL